MLYHREIGFPESLVLKEHYSVAPKYTKHANEAAKNDRYMKIELPNSFYFLKRDIIEVLTEDDVKVSKLVFRLKYSDKYDICVVLMPDTNIIKTVWLNKAVDLHTTLNIDKYDKIK